MSVISKTNFFISIISTIITLACSMFYGICELIGLYKSYFDPTLAVLTLTLISIIWYTSFTFENVVFLKRIAQSEKEERLKSFSTAILSELKKQYNIYKKISLNGNWSPNDDLSLPITDKIVKNDISIFNSEVGEKLLSFHRNNDRILKALPIESGDPSRFQDLRCEIADNTIILSSLVDSLIKEGGIKPAEYVRAQRFHFGALVPESFPKNPY